MGGRPPEWTAAGTIITLDPTEPVAESKIDATKKMVFYRCTMPAWDSQCFVGLDQFVLDGYVDGDPYVNNTRYFVKIAKN